jgi:hypothetical protein
MNRPPWTAGRIFELGDGPEDGFQIDRVKSVLELAAYLKRSESRAAITIELGKGEFKIPENIGGRTVTAIADNAFKPVDKGISAGRYIPTIPTARLTGLLMVANPLKATITAASWSPMAYLRTITPTRR